MAVFNMADQFGTGVDATLDLNDGDSRKRPLDATGDSRQSYKRSNLGGRLTMRKNSLRKSRRSANAFRICSRFVYLSRFKGSVLGRQMEFSYPGKRY